MQNSICACNNSIQIYIKHVRFNEAWLKQKLQ